MKIVLAIVVCFIGSMVFAQQDQLTWPREIKAGDNYIISLYQPQLETLVDNKLNGDWQQKRNKTRLKPNVDRSRT